VITRRAALSVLAGVVAGSCGMIPLGAPAAVTVFDMETVEWYEDLEIMRNSTATVDGVQSNLIAAACPRGGWVREWTSEKLRSQHIRYGVVEIRLNDDAPAWLRDYARRRYPGEVIA
jgi:hypothetical protein